MRKTLILLLVLVSIGLISSVTLAEAEPLGYPWNFRGEVTNHFGGDATEGLKFVGSLEQGIDLLEVGSGWLFNTFMGLTLTTRDSYISWDNKLGGQLGFKVSKRLGERTKLSLGVRGEGYTYPQEEVSDELKGVLFLQLATGGSW